MAAFFLIFIAAGGLDSGNTGLSVIPLDLKAGGLGNSGIIDDQADTPDDIGADVVTNRRKVLADNSSLQQAMHEDVAPAPRPNIVIMMADNMGYMDPGCYGGGAALGAPTPRMDQMAKEGLRLTSFYSETQCTPTRAAMLTGRLPIRTGWL